MPRPSGSPRSSTPRRASPWPRRAPRRRAPSRWCTTSPPRPDAAGSSRVAEQVAAWAGPRLKALTLELGGHGPLVVLPDADLDVAADVAVSQGYVNAGQACYAVNRVLVPPDRAPGLLERVRGLLGG